MSGFTQGLVSVLFGWLLWNRRIAELEKRLDSLDARFSEPKASKPDDEIFGFAEAKNAIRVMRTASILFVSVSTCSMVLALLRILCCPFAGGRWGISPRYRFQ